MRSESHWILLFWAIGVVLSAISGEYSRTVSVLSLRSANFIDLVNTSRIVCSTSAEVEVAEVAVVNRLSIVMMESVAE
jgi:hypothetical protein